MCSDEAQLSYPMGYPYYQHLHQTLKQSWWLQFLARYRDVWVSSTRWHMGPISNRWTYYIPKIQISPIRNRRPVSISQTTNGVCTLFHILRNPTAHNYHATANYDSIQRVLWFMKSPFSTIYKIVLTVQIVINLRIRFNVNVTAMLWFHSVYDWW